MLFPVDPDFTPEALSMQIAMDYVAEVLPHVEDIRSVLHKNIVFIDPGCDLYRVTCPSCGADLLENGYWGKVMKVVFDKGIDNPTVIPPCCGEETYIFSLEYDPPVGFARYILEMTNSGKELPDYHIMSLEAFLDCRLRQIRVYQPDTAVRHIESRN
jgi:hypothetical protein